MRPEIRSASPADAAALAAIYNWYVEHTIVTFEVEPVPADEMARRIEAVLAAHEWLVLAHGEEVLGYAYAGRFHQRAGYALTTESTIYLRHGLEGQGLGSRLYPELVRRTFARGYRHLIGAIALPNEASVRLHEKVGFVEAGRLRRVGHKLGRWIDVGHWQLEPCTERRPEPGGAGRRASRRRAKPMNRIPEPELMLDPEQAQAYAAADFAEPHERCVALLRARLELPPAGSALDLGCGPGDPTLRLARALPGWRIEGIDGSPAMLALAREAALRAGLAERVRFHEALLPAPPAALAGRRFELVFSNSLLHHLADPAALWEPVRRLAAPGACVFVMDLLRPPSIDEARDLVARHAAAEPELLRRDFFRSLCAAYRSDEVRAQLRGAGLGALAFEVVSDRHWIAWGRVS